MTKPQRKIASERIAEFDYNNTMFVDYYAWDKLLPVIDQIQELGYSFMLGSLVEVNIIKFNTASFIDVRQPYNNVIADKGKTKLDAVFELVYKFICEYKERPVIEDTV